MVKEEIVLLKIEMFGSLSDLTEYRFKQLCETFPFYPKPKKFPGPEGFLGVLAIKGDYNGGLGLKVFGPLK